MKNTNMQGAVTNVKKKGHCNAAGLALVLVITLLAGSLQPAGSMTVYASSGGDEETVIGENTSVADESGETSETEKDSDPTAGDSGGISDTDDEKRDEDGPEDTEPGADGSDSGESQDDASEITDPAEDDTPSDMDDGMFPDEDTDDGEETGEDVITFFESEEVIFSTDAMMASASSADGYDPTSLYAWVRPAPRGDEEYGIPPEKTTQTKTLAEGTGDIARWDHIYFGVPNRNGTYGSPYYYDYGEETVWLDHIRWRVLDPLNANTALNSNGVMDRTVDDDAMFLISEGAFGKNAGERQYLDSYFSVNQNTGSFYNTSSKSRLWCIQFPDKNFTSVETAALKTVSKTDVAETIYSAKGNNSSSNIVNGMEYGKMPVYKPANNNFSGGTMTDAKVFFLSVTEVNSKHYGFNGNGTDPEGRAHPGYKIVYTGDVWTPNDFDPDNWDSRILPWNGVRDRGKAYVPRYSYMNSASWRLRNNNDGNSSGSVVSGMQTTWYASAGGIVTLAWDQPAAFRPGMNILKDSVLFISEADSGKNDGEALTWLNLYEQTPRVITEYKLTLHDESRENFTASVIVENGKKVIHYENAATGDNEYISVLIKDKDGNIRWYGRIAASEGEGNIPVSALDGYWRRGYADELYVFTEQHNPARESDYASRPLKVDDVDETLCADTDELHWVMRPERIRHSALTFNIANATDAAFVIKSVVFENADGSVHTGGYYRTGNGLAAGTVIPAENFAEFEVITAGAAALYEKNRKLDPVDLVIRADSNGTEAEIRVKLTCTVLRARYETDPDESEINTVNLGMIAPEDITDGTMSAKKYSIANNGRQDLLLSATLSGEFAERFVISEGATGRLPAAAVGAESHTHTFVITSTAGEEIPEGRHTITLNITLDPVISDNTAIPEEERPDEENEETREIEVPFTFRIAPKTYRVETDADEAEMDDCYPEDAYDAPEREVVFSNTGRYPVKMTVDDLTEEEKVFFTIESVRSGDTVYQTGDEISVGMDEAVTVTLKAVKSEVHATRQALYRTRKAVLHVHAAESDITNGTFSKDMDVAVSYRMYPKALEWEATPKLVNFGSVMPENMAGTPEMVVSITNTGRETVTLSDLVIAGDGKAAFRFRTTPRANNPIEPGETIEESVKLYSGMTDGVEYNAEIRAKINGSTDRKKICDLRVYSGKAEYELTPRVTYVDFYMDPENMESARTAITFENTGRKTVKVRNVKIVSDNGEIDRFLVTEFEADTPVSEKGRLDFYIKPNIEDVQIGQEFSAKLYLETDPAEAYTDYIELHMYMDQVMYLMNRELPQNTDTLVFREILPEAFDAEDYSETVRFANSGREELHITGIDFDDSIADCFTKDVYMTDEEGNRKQVVLEEGERVLFPTDSKLEIEVRPTRAILEYAGKETVTGAIRITTAEMQKEQIVNLNVTVARYPYQIERDKDSFDLGDYFPEDAAPEKTVALENTGRNDVYLLAPETETGKERQFEVVSVVIGKTTYTDFTSPLLFPKDSRAAVTVRAVRQAHTLTEPAEYTATLTVRAVTDKDTDPPADAIDPIVLTASYHMYAPKFQTEMSPAAVSFTENVEPYQLDAVDPVTVSITNTGRMTLVPAGDTFGIEAGDAFIASDFLVNGETYDAEANPFSPGSVLSFQVRPKDDLEENTTYAETLKIPLKTAGDVPVSDAVRVPATISVPLPKERLQSAPDADVAVDFGKLAPVDDYQQPAKRSVVIKNTGRDTVTITGVAMTGDQAYAFKDVVFSGPVTLKTEESVTVYVQPKAQPEDPEDKFERGAYETDIVVAYTNDVTNIAGSATIGTVAFEINKKDYHIEATVAAEIERGWKVWDGMLETVNPEEEPEGQKITLRNIGNESVTVTDAMLTAGTAHFKITGSSPAMPEVLAPDAEMTVTVLPYDLEAETTYNPRMRIYTDPDEAAFTVSMILKVPKMPYILSQDAQSFTFAKVTAVNPGETYTPETKTLTVSNKGREKVTVSGFTFADGDESGFEIVSVKNGEEDTVTGQEAIRAALPLTLAPDTDLVIVVATKASVAKKPGTAWKDTLSVNIAETEDIACDLDVAVELREYDLQFTEQDVNEPVAETILLGDYYPENTAPSVTIVIRNTGKKNVELQPIAYDPSVISASLRVGGKPYHEELNYTLKGSENTSKAGDREAILTITAVKQSVGVYGSAKESVRAAIAVTGTGEEAGATEHTTTSFDVLFDMYAEKYALQVTEGTADFDDVGHEALGTTDEKSITVKNTGREHLIPAEGMNHFTLVSEQGSNSVFTIGQGMIDGKPYDAAANPFTPGKELTFTVKPKEETEERAEYTETLTASFAAGSETLTAVASARICVQTTAYRLETDRTAIDFGARSKGGSLPGAEPVTLHNTGRYDLNNVQLTFTDATRMPSEGGDAVSVEGIFAVTGSIVSIPASGSVQISVRPDLDLLDDDLVPGIYRAKLKLTADAGVTPSTPEGKFEQHVTDVTFWVGERPYYLVPERTSVAFNEAGSPVAPETEPDSVSVNLKNMGANEIDLSKVQIALSGADAASFQTDYDKEAALKKGESTGLTVSVAETLTPEKSYRAEIVITFPDDYNHPAIRIPVTMEVDREAYAAVIEAPEEFAFEDIDPDDTSYEPEKKTFKIRNTGKGDLIPVLTITGVKDTADKDAFDKSVTINDRPFHETDNPFEPGKDAVITISPKTGEDGFTPNQKHEASLVVGFRKPGESAQDETLQNASVALSYRVLRETYAWDTKPAGTEIGFQEIDPDKAFAAETKRITIINNGRNPLTIVDAYIDGEGAEAFEIDADSLVATRLESQDVSALDSVLNFTVKTKQHVFEEGKTYEAKIVIKAFETDDLVVEIPLSVTSLRRSYAPVLDTESIVFRSEMDGSVEEGIEPEYVLSSEASLKLTNNGRDPLTVTNVRFTGTYRSVFTTDAIPAGGITLDAEKEGVTQSHTFTIALTDKEYSRLTTREDVTYEAAMVIDAVSGDGAKRTITVPVSCYVRQKQYRIETDDSGLDLGIADYAYEDVSGHVKEVVIRNTGRNEVTVGAVLEKGDESVFVLQQSDGSPADGVADLQDIAIEPGDHTTLTVQARAYDAIKEKVSSSEDTDFSDRLILRTNHASGTSGTADKDNSAEISIDFTVRKPHYQIATDVPMINFGWISCDDDQKTLDKKKMSVTVTNIGNIEAKVSATLADNTVTYEKEDGTEESVELFELVTAEPETVNRYGTATFTVRPKSALSVANDCMIPAGSYQVKLLFTPAAVDGSTETDKSAVQEVILYLWVQEKPDETEIQIDVSPASVDLGEACIDDSDVDGSAHEARLTISNKTDAGTGDGSVTFSAEINPADGAFELATPADFSEAVSSGGTRALTIRLRENKDISPGSYMAIVTVKATGTANTSKSATVQIPVMIRIKEKPTEEIMTYGIATDTEFVEFDKIDPEAPTPAAVPVTIHNTGTDIIRVNGITLTDEKAYESTVDYEEARTGGEDRGKAPGEGTHFFVANTLSVNLSPDASCVFMVRPDDGFEAGKIYTATVLITTDRSDVRKTVELLFGVRDVHEDVVIVPSGVIDFGEKNPEDTTIPPAKNVRITNDGNITIRLNGIASVSGSETTDHYALSDYYLGNRSVEAPEENNVLALAPGETFYFTVQPESGLAAGNYTEKIVVSAEGDAIIHVPVSYRVLAVPEEYWLQTDKPFADLGEAPSDYSEKTQEEITTGITVTNGGTHPVWLTAPVLDNPETFTVRSFTVNGKTYDPAAQGNAAGMLEPGESAEITVTAVKHLAENSSYDTVLRIKAYKEENDPQDKPDDFVATAAIPVFFRVSTTPSDAYVMEVTESLSFESDPENSPLSEKEIKKISGQNVIIANKGSRDITITEIAFSGEEAQERFTLHAFTYGDVTADAFAETTLAPGETLVFTVTVNSAYENFGENAVYEAALTVKTNRLVGGDVLAAEIPVTFTVTDLLPDGIWMEDIPDQTYTGAQIRPAVKVYYGRKELTEADYTVTYKNNTNAAASDAVNAKGVSVAPSVIVKGKGTYTGQITKTFTIMPLDIRDAVFPADDAVRELNTDPEEDALSGIAGGNTVTVQAVHLVMNMTNKAVTKVNLTPTYTLPSGKTVKLAAKDFVIRPSEARLLVKDNVTNTYTWSESTVEMKNTGIYKVPVCGLGNYAGDGTPRYVYVEIVNTNKKLGAVETRTPISKVTLPAFPAQEYRKVSVPVQFKMNLVDKTDKKNPKDLVEGKDYLVTYTNNDRVGTASITITGIGDYYGSVTKTFQIKGTPLSKTEVAKITGDDAYHWIVSKDPALDSAGTFAGGTADGKTYVSLYDSARKAFRYTGAAYEVAGSPDGADSAGIGLRYNKGTKMQPDYEKLVKGTHYTVSYTGNTNPGTATVIFTGNPEEGYTGTVKKTFKIYGALTQEEVKVSLTGEDGITDNWTTYKDSAGKMVQADPAPRTAYSIHSYGTYYSGFAYRKGGVKPKPVVKYGEEVLAEGVDYQLTWQNNNPSAVVAVDRSDMKKFKQPTVTITGLGRFKGSKLVVKFDIYMDHDTPWAQIVTFSAGDVAWKSAGASSTLKPALTLTDIATGTVLKSGTDYYPAADKKVNDTSLLIQYYYADDTVVERLKTGANGKATKESVRVTVPAGSAVSRDAKRTTDVEADGVACTVVADDIIPAGTRIRVVVTGKGFYEGRKIETSFRYINNNVKNATPEKVVQDISKMTVSIPNQQWTGKAIVIDESSIIVSFKAKETVMVGNKTKTQTVTRYLEGGRDFEIVEGSFANNVNTGTAKVTIRGTYNEDNEVTFAGVKIVTFKIVARQMSYSLSYRDNNEAFLQAAAEYVKLYGTDDERKAMEEGNLGEYFRVTGTMADSTTAYGSNLPANKFTVQRKVAGKWTTMNAKKDHAIVFSEWTLKGNSYESFPDKGLFVFRQSAWYNSDTGFGGSIVGNWYRKLVYGDGITLYAQWEVK